MANAPPCSMAGKTAKRAGPERPARTAAPDCDRIRRGPTPRPGAALNSIPQTGAYLNLGRSKVYDLITSGALPSVSIGRRRFVRTDDLEAFVANLQPSVPNGRDR